MDGVYRENGTKFDKVGRKRTNVDTTIESIDEEDLPHRSKKI